MDEIKYKCCKCGNHYQPWFDADELKITNDKEKCILHCEKNNWTKDDGKTIFFWKKLNEYIINVNIQDKSIEGIK